MGSNVRILLALGLLLCRQAQALIADVRIVEAYGGGGLSSAPYKADFIGLYNHSADTVDLSVASLQFASQTGSSWTKYNLSGSIGPWGFFLIQTTVEGANGISLPTPDIDSTAFAMSAAGNKVALVNSTVTTLSGTCPLPDVIVIDFLGWGATANCAEGTRGGATGNTTSSQRTDVCVDSNDNLADFSVAAPNPRNSSTSANNCGAGGDTPTATPTASPSATPSNTPTRSPTPTASPTVTPTPTPTTRPTPGEGNNWCADKELF